MPNITLYFYTEEGTASMRKVLLLLCLLLTLVCSACGASAAMSTGTALDLPNYWHITVSLASSNATVQDGTTLGGIATPQPGNRFIALQVTAANVQSSDPTGAGSEIYASDFRLYPVENNTAMSPAGRDDFSGNMIPPGSAATATLYYQVPTQGGTYELDFQLHAVATGTHAQCNITVPSAN